MRKTKEAETLTAQSEALGAADRDREFLLQKEYRAARAKQERRRASTAAPAAYAASRESATSLPPYQNPTPYMRNMQLNMSAPPNPAFTPPLTASRCAAPGSIAPHSRRSRSEERAH